jgi:hypothetical protein
VFKSVYVITITSVLTLVLRGVVYVKFPRLDLDLPLGCVSISYAAIIVQYDSTAIKFVRDVGTSPQSSDGSSGRNCHA